MASIIPGFEYDIRLRLSYRGHIFISYRQKNEGEMGRLGDEGTKRQDSVTSV